MKRKHLFEEYLEALESYPSSTAASCTYILRYYKQHMDKFRFSYDVNTNTFLYEPTPVQKSIAEKLQFFYDIFEAYLKIQLADYGHWGVKYSHYKIIKKLL